MNKSTNAVTLTGNIKNVVSKGTQGNLVTGNISLRGDDGKCITTMPLVFIDNGDSALGLTEGTLVQVIGELHTRFDRRPGIENAQRYKPYTQIKVSELVVL